MRLIVISVAALLIFAGMYLYRQSQEIDAYHYGIIEKQVERCPELKDDVAKAMTDDGVITYSEASQIDKRFTTLKKTTLREMIFR